MPIAEWLGIDYTPPVYGGDMSLDDELKLTVDHAREWIANIYQRIYQGVQA